MVCVAAVALGSSTYASKAGEATMLAGSRFAVGGIDADKRPEYALKQSFDIGTTDAKAGSFQNLKVANIAIDAGANSTGSRLYLDGRNRR